MYINRFILGCSKKERLFGLELNGQAADNRTPPVPTNNPSHIIGETAPRPSGSPNHKSKLTSSMADTKRHKASPIIVEELSS